MATVLLVEDEPGIADTLRMAFEDAGHRLAHAGSLSGARAWLATDRPDAILLDLGLPDGDGLELAREVLGRSTVPLLILTARRNELDRVLGLELGADDYVVKPFSPREVVARVHAVLRRQGWEQAPRTAPAVLRCGPVTVDPERREALVSGRPVALTATELQLLTTLARRPGVVYSREQLVELVWSGAYIQDRVVDSVVSRLRRKLDDAGAPGGMVRTVHGIGYALGA